MAAQSFDSDEAVDFRARFREWVTSAAPDKWARRATVPLNEPDEEELRRAWSFALWEGGFAGVTWPVEYGGLGLGPIEEFIFYEESARAGAPDAVDLVGKYLAGPAIVAYGTDVQKERYLERILRGADVWCEGFSEPEAGSDLANVSTRAERVDGGFIVSGQKTWTSFAHVADKCYLLAKTSWTERRHHNLSLLLLDMKQPGVAVSPIRQISARCEFNDVFFDAAHVADSDLLGELNQGWHLAGLTGFRRLRAVREGLRRYIAIRHLVDMYRRCLAECPTSRRRSSPDAEKLAGQTELLKWHTRRLAQAQARGQQTDGPASVIKVYWSELLQRTTHAGLALHCAEHGDYWRLEYLESRSATIAGGTSEIQRNVIAERSVGLPR
jgi:alkylation response protein AidB-like acyl-CoA dehydrogenase